MPYTHFTAQNLTWVAYNEESLVGIGDLVVVKGVVHTNVDLGSGYNYSMLIEEASFTHWVFPDNSSDISR